MSLFTTRLEISKLFLHVLHPCAERFSLDNLYTKLAFMSPYMEFPFTSFFNVYLHKISHVLFLLCRTSEKYEIMSKYAYQKFYVELLPNGFKNFIRPWFYTRRTTCRCIFWNLIKICSVYELFHIPWRRCKINAHVLLHNSSSFLSYGCQNTG